MRKREKIYVLKTKIRVMIHVCISFFCIEGGYNLCIVYLTPKDFDHNSVKRDLNISSCGYSETTVFSAQCSTSGYIRSKG